MIRTYPDRQVRPGPTSNRTPLLISSAFPTSKIPSDRIQKSIRFAVRQNVTNTEPTPCHEYQPHSQRFMALIETRTPSGKTNRSHFKEERYRENRENNDYKRRSRLEVQYNCRKLSGLQRPIANSFGREAHKEALTQDVIAKFRNIFLH